MVEFFCTTCNKVFRKKYNYKIHLNRKYPCKPVAHKKLKIHKNTHFQCNHCEKYYTRKYSLKRHLTTCKKKKHKTQRRNI